MPTLRQQLFKHIDEANQGAFPQARYLIKHNHAILPTNRARTKPQQTTQAVNYRFVIKKRLYKPSLTTLDILPPEQPPTPPAPKLLKPARTVWKKGHGSVEKIDAKSGEIMHLAYEPAIYDTIPTLPSPAIRTKTVKMPAQYQLIRIRQAKRINSPKTSQLIPTEIIDQRKDTQQAISAWREYRLIQKVQWQLNKQGYYKHAIDGVFGLATRIALAKAQRQAKLVTGQLDQATLRAIGL
ncbi:MAG: peptidoglycan-binding domain-containing protein [bacterium]